MEMVENDDKKKCEKEVQTCLKDMGMPYHHYKNLSAYHKTLLHNSICQPTKPISPQQPHRLQKLRIPIILIRLHLFDNKAQVYPHLSWSMLDVK